MIAMSLILLLLGRLAHRPAVTEAGAVILFLGIGLLLLDTVNASESFRAPWVMFWDHVVTAGIGP
jgi:hypothetical protein